MSLSVSRQAAASEVLERRQARSSLLNFTVYTKPDYIVNWHHRLMCEYLDRFVSGEISRLMFFVPPRHGKSELVSRRLPAYLFGQNPDISIISCSYSADLASRMNRDVQRIIDSLEYARLYPGTCLNASNIRTSAASGNYLRNSDIFEIVGRSGVYRSTGVMGGITGMGALVGLLDDPIKNRDEAKSRVYRDKVWEWYTSTFYTRLEKDAQILLTMTRWHEDDLAGRIIAQTEEDDIHDEWMIVKLPAVAEPTTFDGDTRAPGEPLWPWKYDSDRLQLIKRTLGSYDWSALYQQHPVPAGGGLFKREWFKIVTEYPQDANRVRYWDMAATENGGDWTAGALVAERDGLIFILDIRHTQASPRRVEELIRQTAMMDGKQVPIRWEEEGGSSGKIVSDHLTRRVLFGYNAKGIRSTGSKVFRAEPVAALAEAGNVYLVKGTWNANFLDEISTFPVGSHDDQVDAVSGAVGAIASMRRGAVPTVTQATGYNPLRR